MSEPVDVDAAVAEIKAKSDQVRTALASIRGVGIAGNGAITATVDSAGHLRDLKLTPEAFRFGNRLAAMILQATAAAEKDAAAKAKTAMRPLTSDHRVEAGVRTARAVFGQGQSRRAAPRTMTEEEIQAADDAYFEQRNRHGWTD
ncbi:YbaB/EbfC family nucleoid-associated protein [Nocardia brasiliensis]|uniref:YbaB/EbfC family nucleoid-associated protein n=1 Tax=Nocardia brasiliensis TaxID=37326 RepID=UPI002456AE63|nr:YbaB/EbfC family nucleoid-associated protein [Nocardia brasiliensis]